MSRSAIVVRAAPSSRRGARIAETPETGAARHEQVLAHRHVEHEALRLPVGGHQAEARRIACAGRGARLAPVDLDRAARGSSPKTRLQELAAPGADEPGEPDDLAGTDVELDVLDMPPAP